MGDESDSLVTSVPIRFMVTSSMFGMKSQVIDTSFEGQGRIICKSDKLDDAVMICEALNQIFGHPQGAGNV
jgi:hypothetical protein